MASITARKDKNGSIISYQIEVYRGRDAYGKKLKPYSMNWKVPDGWKERSIQKELQRVAGEFELNCKSGNVSSNKKTFQQYSDYFLQLSERDNKHKTVFRYKQLLTRIIPEIGYMKLSDVTAEHLNRMYIKWSQPGENKRTGKGLSDQTILHHHRLLHAIFAQALKEGYVSRNIVEMTTPPKAPKHEAKFFEIEEVIAIGKALKTEPLKWQAITELMIDTGARRGEILGIKWSSVDFKECSIKIENNLLYTPDRGIYEDTTKIKENRVVSVSTEIIEILRTLKKEQLIQRMELGDYWHDTGYCFVRDNGEPMHPDSINTWLAEFSKRHDLPHIHPHKFRHTQASLLYAGGGDPITISKRLGHKQVSTTQNLYSHMLKDSDRKASNIISDLLHKKA